MTQGADERVPWEQARATNLANWESRVPLHVEAYGLDRLRQDPAALSTVAATDLAALERFLPDGVQGLDLCHLQCHIGTDTVSFARAGARVTGVDFSPAALEAAGALAAELGIDARWVECDVLDAHVAVADSFDLVYTSIGTITWLPDLDRWAAQIAGLLRPGGLFYIRDGHPMLFSLDEEAEGLPVRYRYFADGRAQRWVETTTYIGDGTVASPDTLEYPHPLSEVVNAIIDAGLTVLRLDEGDTLPWKFSDDMVELDDGEYAFPAPMRERVPTTFTLVARR